MLNPQRLRILLELKQRGTIAEVAKALSYTSSAVSQQLAVLATEVRAPLLEPVGRRVRLTSHAEILLRHAAPLLERMELAEAELAESTSGVRGTVRLATFQTAFLRLVPPLLVALGEHPHVRLDVVHIQPDTGFAALAAHECDLLVAEEYPGFPLPRPEEIHTRTLVREPVDLLASPPWVDPQAASPLEGVRDAPWVMEPRGNAARAWATAVCREAGFEPQVRFESPDLLVQLRLVETGHAVALVPRLVSAGVDPALVRAVPGGPTRRILTAVRAGATAHPVIALVRDRLSAVVDGGDY